MQRIGRRSRLKAGTEDEYIKLHRDIWPEMKNAVVQAGIKNYSIYLDGCDLFSYFEVEDLQRAHEFLEQQPVAQKWQEAMAPLMDTDDPIMPWQVLEEVFHLD
jgi:L-rhamnose mutarotase